MLLMNTPLRVFLARQLLSQTAGKLGVMLKSADHSHSIEHCFARMHVRSQLDLKLKSPHNYQIVES